MSGEAEATAEPPALASEPPAPPRATPPLEPAGPRAAERPRPAGATKRETKLALGAWGATETTALPSAELGGGGSLAWTPGALRIELDGGASAPQSRTAPESTAGARFTAAAVGAGACHAIARRPVELSPCAGARVHFVYARGFGATANYDASARWAAVDAGLLARVPITSSFALRARLDGEVPLARPTFAVEDVGDVHRPRPIGARGTFGAELTFL